MRFLQTWLNHLSVSLWFKEIISLSLMALAGLCFLVQRVHFRLKNSRPLKLYLSTPQSKAMQQCMQLRRLKKETKWSDVLKCVKNHCKLYIGNPCRPLLHTYCSHFWDFPFNLLSRNCIKFICLGTKFEFDCLGGTYISKVLW